MAFAVGVALGLLIGFGLLAFSRRADDASSWPTWTALGLGVAAVGAFAVGVAGLIDTAFAIIPVLTLQFAAITFAAGRLLLGYRSWRSWLAAVLAAIPAGFWVFFAVAELLGPRH